MIQSLYPYVTLLSVRCRSKEILTDQFIPLIRKIYPPFYDEKRTSFAKDLSASEQTEYQEKTKLYFAFICWYEKLFCSGGQECINL